MKIAFVGKGGSGKTTLSALFTLYLAQKNKKVLAIDSDINQHLGIELGFSQAELNSIPSMGQDEKFVYQYLSKNELDNFIRTTPPKNMESMLPFDSNNELRDRYELTKNGIRLLRVGLPDYSSIGKQCYHVNMGVLQAYINHLLDKSDEYVIVDLTAGIDTVSSGMFTSYDIIYVAVEPTRKSTEVFKDYQKLIEETDYSVSIFPIANKVASQSDIQYIIEQTGIEPITKFDLNNHFGRTEAINVLMDNEILNALSILQTHTETIEKNHPLVLDRIRKLHEYKTKKA